MTEEEFFVKQIELVFTAQRNKSKGRDSLVYENNIIALTIRGMRSRYDKTLRIENNYAFLVSLPRWREIMATEFEGRKIDHEICEVLIPTAEKILSPYTFNNRVGKGTNAAINQLIEHICEESYGYTRPCRCIKLDFKGYFPNASWDYAEKVICNTLDTADIDDEYRNYLKWLTMVSVHCNPAEHCELRTPKYMWREHIEPEKSIFCKDEGYGAAIGRLIWQTAMGLYINDIILWLTEECGIKVVVFVDDIVMVVPEYKHQYALSLIPEIRRRLAERSVRLNEKKFYDQPYEHGLEFLGSHIKPYRIHLNNSTYGRAVDKIRKLNRSRRNDIDMMLSMFNSYSGQLKNRTDYKRLIELKDMLDPKWWEWLEFDNEKLCLQYKEGYSINERINRKYNLKIKKYETIRSTESAERAVHLNQQPQKQTRKNRLCGHPGAGARPLVGREFQGGASVVA